MQGTNDVQKRSLSLAIGYIKSLDVIMSMKSVYHEAVRIIFNLAACR